MDPESKNILQENLEITKENNVLLKKIWGDIVWKRVFNVIYWVVIILLTLGAYYYIQPYLDRVLNMLTELNNTASGLKNITEPGISELNKMIPGLKVW